eukprot:jgi/Mesen1/5837/ME000297S05029
MATRNRTQAFLKYRDALKQPRADTSIEHENGPQRPTTGGGYIQLQPVDSFRGNGASTTLPPMWVDVSEKVKEDMQRLKSKTAELSKAHARALLPTFDNENTHDETVELLTQEITIGLKRCEKSLQRLTKGSTGGEDNNIARNVQRSMATDLQQLSMDFRKMQKGYLRRLQAQQEGASNSGLPTPSQSVQREDDDLFDPGFDERQTMRVRRMEASTVEREQEMKEIVQSVNDLAQVMRDLSVLVIDQGTIVDRIDYNIQNVGAAIDKGMKHLKKMTLVVLMWPP